MLRKTNFKYVAIRALIEGQYYRTNVCVVQAYHSGGVKL
jgi:hypothetical protein